jgi:hypothetical protein
MQTTPLAPAFSYLLRQCLLSLQRLSISRCVASSSSGSLGGRLGGARNGVYNACAPCGSPCGYSAYGIYDHYADEIYHHPIPGPSLHLLSEEPLLLYGQSRLRSIQGSQQSGVI